MQQLTTTVKKSELVEILNKNKEAHRGLFEKAIAEYRESAILELESWLKLIKSGQSIRAYTQLHVPEDHTDDYARVIRMMSMHQNETVELTENQFAQYVMDEWGWKTEFQSAMLSNSTYSATLPR